MLIDRANTNPKPIKSFAELYSETDDECKLDFINGKTDLLIIQVEEADVVNSLNVAGKKNRNTYPQQNKE